MFFQRSSLQISGSDFAPFLIARAVRRKGQAKEPGVAFEQGLGRSEMSTWQ
jgi:hypothetical protein